MNAKDLPYLTPAKRAALRRRFEDWVSGPPYELEIMRLGKESSWPGQYSVTKVQLAWEAWVAGQGLEHPDEEDLRQ